MAGLVLEGGSFRGIFSAGVMDELLANNIDFNYIIGTSAGISNGASFISKQEGRNLQILKIFRNDKRYAGITNLITDKSIIGIEFVFETIPNDLLPFDYKTYSEYKGKALACVSNGYTGKAEYLDVTQIDEHNQAYKATCSIPGLFPPQMIDGVPYFDGGATDSIPIIKSMEDGNKKNVVILTQPLGYKKRFGSKEKLVIKTIQADYPKLAKALEKRAKIYNLTIDYINRCEELGLAFVFRPTCPIKSSESSIEVLESIYLEGRQCVKDRLEELQIFLK